MRRHAAQHLLRRLDDAALLLPDEADEVHGLVAQLLRALQASLTFQQVIWTMAAGTRARIR